MAVAWVLVEVGDCGWETALPASVLVTVRSDASSLIVRFIFIARRASISCTNADNSSSSSVDVRNEAAP